MNVLSFVQGSGTLHKNVARRQRIQGFPIRAPALQVAGSPDGVKEIAQKIS